MAISQSEALVLSRQSLRETSLIVTFLTKDFGKIKGILRGVRGPRAATAGASCEVFARDAIVFYPRKTGDIFTVSQCDLIDFYPKARESIERLAYGTYMMELADSVTALGEPCGDIYALCTDSLNLLSTDSSPKRAARIFELRLLALSGLMPALDRCVECGKEMADGAFFSIPKGGLICSTCNPKTSLAKPMLTGTVRYMRYVVENAFEKASRVKVSREVGKELEATLGDFLNYHIERRLKSAEFIHQIDRVLDKTE